MNSLKVKMIKLNLNLVAVVCCLVIFLVSDLEKPSRKLYIMYIEK
jgi:hypothetical protein